MNHLRFFRKEWRVVNMAMAMVFSSVLLSCGNTPTEGKAAVKHNLNLVEITIPVEGMTCEGCENTVNQQLLKLQGLQSAQASHTMKQVLIKIDTNITSIEEVERNIEQVGYTVVK